MKSLLSYFIFKLKKKLIKKVGYKQLKINSRHKILIVSPHPDDETFYCFGLLFNQRQKNISVLCLTHGKNLIRKDEFFKVMKYLKVKNYLLLDNYEGQIKDYGNINIEKFDYIFIPNLKNYHTDHFAAHEFLRININKVKKKLKIFSYEDNGTLSNPTHYLDISPNIKTKIAAIKKYKSQLGGSFKFLDHIYALNRYRGTLCNKSYAEFYQEYSIKDFLKSSSIL
jgi:LmbE family N-acetylglucosaminyl deacetylase